MSNSNPRKIRRTCLPWLAGLLLCPVLLLPTGPAAARSRASRRPARIEAVHVEGHGRDATVRVRATRPCRVVRASFSDPERLVLDFTPARWSGDHPKTAGGPVRGVRVAQHGARRVRVVVDTGPRSARWSGGFQGAEWVGRGRVQDNRRSARNRGEAEDAAPRRSLRDMVIGIDPGHGGSDPGAISKCGLKEKDVTLAIAKRLRRLLKKRGARVLMTRTDDRRLQVEYRKAFVAGSGADLIVSIHCDALEGPSHCTGITSYYHGRSRRSQELARALQRQLTAATGLPDRGARPDTTCYDTGFYVLRYAGSPAVLVETGYLSSPATAARLRQSGFRSRVARGILDGLRHYVTTAPVRTARR